MLKILRNKNVHKKMKTNYINIIMFKMNNKS
jgi:hypothetical protein